MHHTNRVNNHAKRDNCSGNSCFNRDLLPKGSNAIVGYYSQQGVILLNLGEWRSAICPFHSDKKPSLRVCADTGAFRCMSCGVKGGSILDFHILKHGTTFKEAAIALGAWTGGTKQ